jgi:hypothetical protein
MASGAPAAKEAARAAARSERGFHLGFDDNYHLVISGSASAFLSEELRRRFERFNRLDQRQQAEQLQEGAVRYGSYVAFALLPLFAALQFATYAGQRGGRPGRPRVYAEHLVYSAHIHTFWFLIAMIALLAPWTWLRALLAAWGIYYVIRAKHDVYGGAWWGRAVRTLGVAVVYAITLVLATVVLVFVAALFE